MAALGADGSDSDPEVDASGLVKASKGTVDAEENTVTDETNESTLRIAELETSTHSSTFDEIEEVARKEMGHHLQIFR